MGISDLSYKYAAFDLWITGEGEDNRAELEKVKNILPIVLDEVCTVSQKKYIMAHFAAGMSVTEIAKRYGVNASTVSRTIDRGLDRAYSYLKFLSPLFIKAPKRRIRLSNKTRGR